MAFGAFASLVLMPPGVAVMSSAAWAQPGPSDLKALAPGQQVSFVRYCRGMYEVALKDGSVRTFKEFDLGFKTDTSARGPTAAAPALVPTGRVGDRAFVIFAGLDELKTWLKAC
jgi:cytochrome c